jgi:dihydroflavonol-4-reductase
LKTLVTGSNGFIGSFLVERLLEKEYQVFCLVRKTSDLRWIRQLDVHFITGELVQPSTLMDAVQDKDVVFHLAGVTKAKDYEGYMRGNYQATVNLLEAMEQYGKKDQKLVFVSSQAAGGPARGSVPMSEDQTPQPISSYGKAKLRAEEAVLRFAASHPATIIRPPAVYGPRDKDVLVMFRYVQKGLLPVLGSGQQRLSIVHVDDLVEGVILAAEKKAANSRLYYMSGDGEFTWLEIGQVIARALDKRCFILRLPSWLLSTASFFGVAFSRLGNKPPLLNKDKVKEFKQGSWLCSNRLAKSELGFSPRIDLDEGMRSTAAWYKKMGWI